MLESTVFKRYTRTTLHNYGQTEWPDFHENCLSCHKSSDTYEFQICSSKAMWAPINTVVWQVGGWMTSSRNVAVIRNQADGILLLARVDDSYALWLNEQQQARVVFPRCRGGLPNNASKTQPDDHSDNAHKIHNRYQRQRPNNAYTRWFNLALPQTSSYLEYVWMLTRVQSDSSEKWHMLWNKQDKHQHTVSTPMSICGYRLINVLTVWSVFGCRLTIVLIV